MKKLLVSPAINEKAAINMAEEFGLVFKGKETKWPEEGMLIFDCPNEKAMLDYINASEKYLTKLHEKSGSNYEEEKQKVINALIQKIEEENY